MITTEVMQRGKPRFDMCGHSLPDTLTTTSETISAGLTARLHRYAFQRLECAGFAATVRRPAGLIDGAPSYSEWPCEVYTMDAEDKPANRSYCVRWKNEEGGTIEVVGILTRRGWPSLDHGLAIGEDQ